MQPDIFSAVRRRKWPPCSPMRRTGCARRSGMCDAFQPSSYPVRSSDLGLVATVEWLGRQIRETNPDLRIDLQLDVDESLISPTLKVDLFRIIEEALFNAARHARASRVGVTLVASRTQIKLNIEDDGYGFDAALRRHGDRDFMGVGLHSIGSRIDATNGSMQLESMPGAGTSIVATWPTDGTLVVAQSLGRCRLVA